MIQPFAFLSGMRMLRLHHSFANKSALVSAIQNNKQVLINSTIKTDEEPPEIQIDSDILNSKSGSQGSIVIPTEDDESFVVFEEEEQPQQFLVVEDAKFSDSPSKMKGDAETVNPIVDHQQLFNNSGTNMAEQK